jgi:photosystem II stability/assembly factor-like uncharacterized protein
MYRYDVFISYNTRQLKWVQTLVRKLRDAGIKPFFDKEVGLTGEALYRAIVEGMLASKCCVIVLTPDSVKSEWVGKEIDTALHLGTEERERFTIPLLLKGLKECMIPKELKPISYIDCRKRGFTQEKFQDLVKAIAQRGTAKFVGDVQPSETWRWCYAPRNVDLSELAFTDEFRGVMVGDQGMIFRTLNGGRTWKEQKLGVTENLYSIAFQREGTNGWIVGANSTVLRTDNGGDTWAAVACGIEDDLLAVRYCDGGEGICVIGSNGTILRRGLRATRWNRIRIEEQPSLWSIDFSRDGKLGCAVGANGTILISQDGGRNWKRRVTKFRSPFYTARVLTDGKTICVVGDEGKILISRDGGSKWQDRSHKVKLWESWLNAVDFSPDGQSGWVVGTKGLMLKTADSGNSWTPYTLDGNPELINV